MLECSQVVGRGEKVGGWSAIGQRVTQAGCPMLQGCKSHS